MVTHSVSTVLRNLRAWLRIIAYCGSAQLVRMILDVEHDTHPATLG